MKRYIMRFAIILAVFLGISINAYAFDCSVSKDYSKNTLTVSGFAEKKDLLSVVITKSGVTLQDAWDNAAKTSETHTFWDDYGIVDSVTAEIGEPDNIAFLGIGNSDKDGSFTFETIIEETGVYDIYVTSKKLNTTETIANCNFTSDTDYAAIVTALNNEAKNGNESSFYTLLTANMVKLGFDEIDTGAYALSDISRILYGELKKNALSTTDFTGNKKIFSDAVRAVFLNNTSEADITEYVIDILEQDSLYSYFEELITDSTKKEYFSSKVKGQNISSVSGMAEKCRDAIVLTVVKYPDGYMNIKNVLESVKADYEISSLSSENSVYSDLAGNDYTSVESLIADYKEYARGDSGADSSGSGGGSSTAVSSGYVPSNGTQPNIQINNMTFIDLDTVMWAYEAISTLADKNIISGRSNTKFSPNDNIKREEFVKLIVCAIEEDTAAKGNHFDDVKENEWFYKYVNRGYETGIANGLGGGLFGIGNNITRQDIAVLIYNALKYKDFEPMGGELSFTDSDAIAEYAKNAVSALSNVGIINGYGDGSFSPKAYATRAEAAQLVFGMLNILKQGGR